MAVLVFSLIAASAASLGGIRTADVGADVDVVASCDTDGVDASYATSYDAIGGEYVVDSVTIDGIDDNCVGDAIEVTLTGPLGVVLDTVSGSVAAGTADDNTFNSAVTGVTAAALEGVAVVISG
ncbi:MAG: hypothetical protein WBM90_05000 [Acidimicrobiia bacterium]